MRTFGWATALSLVATLVIGCENAPALEQDAGSSTGDDAGTRPEIDAAAPDDGSTATDASRADAGPTCVPITSWSPSSIVVVPGMAVVLTASTYVDVARVEARFDGGEPLVLDAVGSHSVALAAPMLVPGSHTLVVIGCGGTWEATLEFESAPVVDDAATYLADLVAELSGRVDELEASGNAPMDTLVSLRELLSRFSSSAAGATGAERAAIAAWIAANREAFDPVLPMCAAERCATHGSCLRARTRYFQATLLVQVALALHAPPPPWTRLAPLAVAIYTIATFAGENLELVYGRCVQESLDGLGVVDPLSTPIGGDLTTGGNPSLGSVPANQQIPVALVTEFTSISGAERSGNEVIEALIDAVSGIEEAWMSLDTLLAGVGLSTGLGAVPSRTGAPLSSFERTDLALVRVSLASPPAGLTVREARPTAESLLLTFLWSGTDPVDAMLRLEYDNPGVRTFEQLMPVRVVPSPCGDPSVSQQCCPDGSCRGFATCAGGYCRDRFDPIACTTAADCGGSSSLHCSADGVCRFEDSGLPISCTTDAGCASGVCGVDGLCSGSPLCEPCDAARCGRTPTGACYESSGQPCANDGNCGTAQRCLDGRCRGLGEVGYACASSSGCHGAVCVDGRCFLPSQTCGDREECPEGQACIGERCIVPMPGSCTGCFSPSVCGLTPLATSPTCFLPCGSASCSLGCLGGTCSALDGATCTVDTQCSGMCRNGTCRHPSRPYSASCTRDSDCGELLCGPADRCQVGETGDPCTADDDCDDTVDPGILLRRICGRTGRCQYGVVGDSCVLDLDCRYPATGARCGGGVCGIGALGERCDGNSDCSSPYVCGRLGFCQAGLPGEPCSEDSQCGTAFRCVGAVCRRGEPGDPCVGDSDCPASVWPDLPRPSGICGPGGICRRGITGDPCFVEDHCLGRPTDPFDFSCRFGACVQISP